MDEQYLYVNDPYQEYIAWLEYQKQKEEKEESSVIIIDPPNEE